MFAKAAFLIVVLGVVATALLAVRQLRTQAAHELAETRLRITHRDNQLWRVRARIAEAVAPQRVTQLAAGLNRMQPIAHGAPPDEAVAAAASEQAAAPEARVRAVATDAPTPEHPEP